MKTKTINGTYGSSCIPCKIFVCENWYAVKGSKNLNCTYDELNDGVDVEIINDIDTQTVQFPIESIEDLIEEIGID